MKKFLLLGAAAMMACAANAQSLTKVWEASASAYTTNEARDIAARGKQMIVPNKTNSTIEVWENGAKVLEYALGDFLTANEQSAIGLGISVDDANNIVGNLSFPAATSSSNFVVIPADATDASTAKYLKCSPVGKSWVDDPTKVGRCDFMGDHMSGNLLENGWIVVAANGMTEVMVYNIYGGEQDTDYSYAVTVDEGFAINTETSGTFVVPYSEDYSEIAPKFLVRNRSVNGVRMCDGAKELTNTGVAWDKNSTTTNFTAFVIEDETYVVLNSDQDGIRSHAWGVYKMSDGTKVASWDMPAGEAVNYMVGFASTVNEDGTANIFQYNPGIRFAMYTFDPKGASAIEEVAADNAAVEYYNLQGVKVANPENGIFVKKQGAKATKVVL